MDLGTNDIYSCVKPKMKPMPIDQTPTNLIWFETVLKISVCAHIGYETKWHNCYIQSFTTERFRLRLDSVELAIPLSSPLRHTNHIDKYLCTTGADYANTKNIRMGFSNGPHITNVPLSFYPCAERCSRALSHFRPKIKIDCHGKKIPPAI